MGVQQKSIRVANASSVLNPGIQNKLWFISWQGKKKTSKPNNNKKIPECSQDANELNQQLWVGETQMTGQHQGALQNATVHLIGNDLARTGLSTPNSVFSPLLSDQNIIVLDRFTLN